MVPMTPKVVLFRGWSRITKPQTWPPNRQWTAWPSERDGYAGNP